VKSRLEKIQLPKTAPLSIFNDGNSARFRPANDADIDPPYDHLSRISARHGRQPSPIAKRAALRKEGLRFPGDNCDDEKQKREATTSELWKLHHDIQRLLRPPVAQDGTRAKGPSVCGCGYASTANDDVTLRVRRAGSTPKVSVSGIYRCGLPWVCSICSKRTAVQRQARVQKVAEATQAKGGIFAHVVVTVRHKRGQSLAELKRRR
jgi:hypothetical protein